MPTKRNLAEHGLNGKSKGSRLARCSYLVAATLVLLTTFLVSGFGNASGDAPGEDAVSEASPKIVSELVGKRTATSRTFQLSNGQLMSRLYQAPVNFRDETGDWLPIEEDLEPAQTGGLTNAANSFDLHLPEQMGAGSVRLTRDDQWISYRLLDTTTEEAEVQGETAIYDAAGRDISFELHSLSNGLKEEIVLADSSQPSRYRFVLDLSSGLVPKLIENGSIRIEDSEGERFAILPAPTISDASGTPPSDAVHFNLEEAEEGRWILSVEAGATWLASPDRLWPVTIDPSAFLSTTQDCTIGSTPLPKGWSVCGTGSGWGGPATGPELSVAYSQKENQPVRTFLKFNFSNFFGEGLPSDAYVTSAKLRLYSPKSAENSPKGLEVKRVTRNWTTSLNWERFDGFVEKWTTPGGDFGSEGKTILTPSERGGYGAGWWDFQSDALRDLVRRWNANALTSPEFLPNNGLVVKQVDETKTELCALEFKMCDRRFVAFNSTGASSNKPELDVIYYRKAPTTNKLVSPTEGTMTARRLMLRSAWAPGVTGVRYQYRAGKTGQFEDIPSALLRNAKGEPVEELAVSESCCQSERLYLDAAHLNSALQAKGGVVQVRALFEGGTGVGYSEPIETTVDRYLGGPQDETLPLGPGTLDLLTGNLSLGATDVAIGGYRPLSFSRSYNTRVPGTLGEKSILGQGWNSGAELDGGSEWLSIKVSSGTETIEGVAYPFEYASLKNLKGVSVSFEKVGEEYAPPDELPDHKLALKEGKFVLTDPGGNRTTFSNENSGNPAEYIPVSVTELGGGSTVNVWNIVNNQRRLVRQLAPTSALSASTCAENPTTTVGCHSLEFSYFSATKWGAPSAYGDRLEKITYYAPGEGGPWEVAAYSYDSVGRLTAAWDPRLGSGLKDVYTYEGEKLRKVAKAGEEPWTFEYTPSIDGEGGQVSRLKSIKRSNLKGGETKTSVRYEVPLSGSSAPYDMSALAIAAWGQADLPTDATAVFPPTEVPAEPASSYGKANIYYLDAEGFGVNAAAAAGAGMSGPAISTTETDDFGNITRELSPQNRLRALSDPEGKTVERSHLLETKFSYSGDGTEMLGELGPLHRVKLQEGGEVAEGRLQRSIAYDNPEHLDPAPLLPTREVTGAVFPSKGTEADSRLTEYKYDWNLRAETQVITDVGVGHLNIRRKTVYNSKGQVAEVRQPQASEESGDVAGAVKTKYFGDLACIAVSGSAKWSGLPCKIEPAAQPEGGPSLPIIWIKSYSPFGKPTEVVQEVPGAGEAGIRKTVMTYDSAGRQTSKKVTGGGQSVPKIEFSYSSTNGMPTSQRFVCESSECSGFDAQATSTSYDALGRVVSYEDADGNKAETTYDGFGRPIAFVDGKGSQSMEYDSVTGLLVKLTDSAAGTFTASYDADGNIVKRGLPNGLTAEATYDSTGAAVGLAYVKTSNCGASCNWLNFTADESIYGQTLSEAGSLGTHSYAYDRAGRLVEAQEVPSGGSCTRRSYIYDKNSNRLSTTSTTSALGGACGTGAATEKKFSYDKADRLVDPGVVYDNFGRITTLPASDAGGQALSTTYYSTGLIATQSQGGVTNSFELDAQGRQRSRLQGGGGLEGTEIFHYDNLGDAPSWTSRGAVWTRSILGIDGELVAIQESGKEITLPLTNLHGDVVASAAIDPSATSLKANFVYDEFGIPKNGTAGRFGWQGGLQRRTELPSGVVQMGSRSYVPSIGRFLSTDPVTGGSANAYDYANADPVNQLDPSGAKPYDKDCDPGAVIGKCQVLLEIWMWSPKGKRMGVRMRWRTNRVLGITLISFDIHYWEDVKGPSDPYKEGFVDMSPPHYLNTYPGLPADCRGVDPCAENHDGRGTFACTPGNEYQIQLTLKYRYNQGAEVEVPQILEVKAQQGCQYPY